MPQSQSETPEVTIDLNEFDFAPSWAKALAEGKSGTPTHQHRPEERDPRQRDNNRRPRKDFNRPPSQPRSSNENRSRENRFSGKEKIDTPRHQDRPREPRRPKIIVELLPEATGTESLARQIKVKCRAYPVYDLARMVLQKPERYAARIRFENPHQNKNPRNTPPDSEKNPAQEIKKPQIYHCRIDDTIWSSQEAVVAHILKHHLDKFYSTQVETTDPPKGNFTHVGVCGMTGTTIGPPNYHGYQSAIREIYRTKSIRAPFDVYKSRIKVVKDDELLQKWLQQATEKICYTPLPYPYPKSAPATDPGDTTTQAPQEPATLEADQEETAPAAEATDAEQPATAEDATPTADSATESAQAEQAQLEHTPHDTPDEQPPAENAKPAPEETEQPQAEETDQQQAAAQGTSVEKLYTLAEVEKHFLSHFSKRAIRTVSIFTLRSQHSRSHSDPAILQAIKFAVEAEHNFPMQLGRALIQQLTHMGMKFFKVPPNVLHVTAVAPTPFTADENAVKDTIKAILRHIELNPRCNRRQLLDTLVPDFDQTTTTKSDPDPASVSTTQKPLDKPGAQQALATLKDLHWLIRQGHVVEYANGELELPDPEKQIIKDHSRPDNSRRHKKNKNQRTKKSPQPTDADTAQNSATAPQQHAPTENTSPTEAETQPPDDTSPSPTALAEPTTQPTIDQEKINDPDYDPEFDNASAIPAPSMQGTSPKAP